VLTAKVADDCPAATVTDDGADADELFHDSVTTTPPAGAALARVTVPVVCDPPITDVGLNVTDVGAIALIFSPFVTVVPDAVALIVAIVSTVTPAVATAKVADVCPAKTVTDAGSVALTESDDRLTTSPPVGAADDNVTLPVLEDPPVTDVGVNANEVGTTGLIVREASED